MPTGPAVPLHPRADLRPRRGRHLRHVAGLAGQLLFAAAIIVGGAVAIALLLTFVLVAAPLAAVLVSWIVWRSGDVAARQARRMRSRLRRRARALGLVVLPGTHGRADSPLSPALSPLRGAREDRA